MMRLNMTQVVDGIGAELVSGEQNADEIRFSIDSRTITPGDFFVAVKGKYDDGHDHIEDAVRAGAKGIICEKAPPVLSEGVAVLVVGNTVHAIGRIIRMLTDQIAGPIVCITGSNGKTTVKTMLTRLLSYGSKVLSTPRSFNNILGLAKTVFAADGVYDFAVFEIGTNAPGEIGFLTGNIRPHIAVITNIGEGHIGNFGSKENIYKEKLSIADNLRPGGMLLINGDDKMLRSYNKGSVQIKTYGSLPDSDHRVVFLPETNGRNCFTFNGTSYELPVRGGHNVYNAAAALSVCAELGIDDGPFKDILFSIELPYMRLEEKRVNDVTFIMDCYNSNPTSFLCGIDVLRSMRVHGRKWVIAGDMMELGSLSSKYHFVIGENIADAGVNGLITLGNEASLVAVGAENHGMDKSMIFICRSIQDILDVLRDKLRSEDVIYVKGSRQMKMEEILNCFTISCTR